MRGLLGLDEGRKQQGGRMTLAKDWGNEGRSDQIAEKTSKPIVGAPAKW